MYSSPEFISAASGMTLGGCSLDRKASMISALSIDLSIYREDIDHVEKLSNGDGAACVKHKGYMRQDRERYADSQAALTSLAISPGQSSRGVMRRRLIEFEEGCAG